MTHLSSFRYNPSVLDRPEGGGRSSEVRVRYFDPATGEPRGEHLRELREREALLNEDDYAWRCERDEL